MHYYGRLGHKAVLFLPDAPYSYGVSPIRRRINIAMSILRSGPSSLDRADLGLAYYVLATPYQALLLRELLRRVHHTINRLNVYMFILSSWYYNQGMLGKGKLHYATLCYTSYYY